MDRYDLALIGCGGVSAMHLDGYRRHPERVRVVAACDPDEASLEGRRTRYEIPRGYSSLDRMIEDAGWDVAVVCTPTPVRAAVIERLAAAGKPIFIEKPLASTLDEAERIVETCRKAGVALAVDQNFRYHFPFHVAKRLIAEGKIGRVIGVVHQDLMFRRDAGWRMDEPRHALAVMGIHWLDGFRWTLGCEAESIACRTERAPAVGCRGETEALAQIVMEDGTAVQYAESFSSPVSRAETVIFGDRGSLTLGYQGTAFFAPGERGEGERWPNPYGGDAKPESAFRCLDELLDAIDEGREPSNSGADNLKTMALLEGAYRSAELGRAVRFKEGRPV